nr:copper fist DNA-binding domain protein [Trametes gibbosa]
MVLVGEKKYACETCIKGHRSSSCKHTDRPLFEIKKKGRPVTQCEHCRELRKTRQIHVKCLCETKDGIYSALSLGPGPSGHGGVKFPARAAFPSGLPEGLLEASVASRPLSEGSDSDPGGRGCSCKDDTTCNCWTPRSNAKRPSRRRNSETKSTSSVSGETISQPAALVVHAHSGNNRPVLPKPPAEPMVSPSRNVPPPPTSAPLRGRSPSHGQSFYSPYGRAYEYAHGHEVPYTQQPHSSATYPPSDTDYIPPPSLSSSSQGGNANSYGDWEAGSGSAIYLNASEHPSLCNCGSTCACAGCLDHNGPNVDPVASCTNPNTCSACLECNIIALTALSSEVTQSFYDPARVQNVDDWLRQVSSLPDFVSSGNPNPAFPSSTLAQSEPRFDEVAYQGHMAWSEDLRAVTSLPSLSSAVESECCGGRCQCPTGLCSCSSGCCGCCQGCSCTGCDHESSSGRTLTFATSGERAPCCGGSDHDDYSTGSPISSVQHTQVSFSADLLSSPSETARLADSTWSSHLLTVPRETLSRASSLSSSKSSPNPSTSSSSPMPYVDPPNSVRDGDSRHTSGIKSCCSSMGKLSTKAAGGGLSRSPPQPGPSSSGFPHSTNFDFGSERTRRYS